MTMYNGLLIFFITLSVSFAIAYLSVSYKLKEVTLSLVQLSLAQDAIEEAIGNSYAGNIVNDEDAHRENFIKFLSDSRDWAFEYIESSQKTIQEVANELRQNGMSDSADKLSLLLPEKKETK